MNKKSKFVSVAVLAVILAGPTAASAGKCSGTNINNVLSWDQTEIAEGTTLATMRITSVTVADVPSASYHLLSGECIGTFLTLPGGATQASGYCARRDQDGDVLNEEWVSTDGAGMKGTWKLAGGTGKFTNAVGTANWEFKPLQGKMSAVRWVGNCD